MRRISTTIRRISHKTNVSWRSIAIYVHMGYFSSFSLDVFLSLDTLRNVDNFYLMLNCLSMVIPASHGLILALITRVYSCHGAPGCV